MRTIYLDLCCLNRPFDDQHQPRVRLEAEAVLGLVQLARLGEVILIGSAAAIWKLSASGPSMLCILRAPRVPERSGGSTDDR